MPMSNCEEDLQVHRLNICFIFGLLHPIMGDYGAAYLGGWVCFSRTNSAGQLCQHYCINVHRVMPDECTKQQSSSHSTDVFEGGSSLEHC